MSPARGILAPLPPPLPAVAALPTSEQDDPERALVEACISGDEVAWDRFVARYRRHVFRVARAWLVRAGAPDSEPLAEDTTADVFAHLLANERQALARFEWRSSLSTWLGVLTRRRAGRLLERGQRAGPLGEPAQLPSDGATPSEVASRHELAGALRRGLQELSPRDRLALQLFYEAGRSYKEVAEALDLPEAHVSSLLARARKRLAKALGQ